MTFNWNDYLLLARFLETTNTFHSYEALQRSAVSRAYYAAFCSAREYAEIKILKKKFPKNPQIHSNVRDTFYQNNRKEIGDNLDDLRRLRNKCDYYNDVKNLHTIVKTAIQLADEVISNL